MFWNHQVREERTTTERQQQDWIGNFDATGQLTTVVPLNGTVYVEDRHTHITETNNTFAYGGELNLELAFEVTQGFAITSGIEIFSHRRRNWTRV